MVYSKEWARAVLRRAYQDTGVTDDQAALLALLTEDVLRPRKKKPWWKIMFGL